jgi:hypothetical protein
VCVGIAGSRATCSPARVVPAARCTWPPKSDASSAAAGAADGVYSGDGAGTSVRDAGVALAVEAAAAAPTTATATATATATTAAAVPAPDLWLDTDAVPESSSCGVPAVPFDASLLELDLSSSLQQLISPSMWLTSTFAPTGPSILRCRERPSPLSSRARPASCRCDATAGVLCLVTPTSARATCCMCPRGATPTASPCRAARRDASLLPLSDSLPPLPPRRMPLPSTQGPHASSGVAAARTTAVVDDAATSTADAVDDPAVGATGTAAAAAVAMTPPRACTALGAALRGYAVPPPSESCGVAVGLDGDLDCDLDMLAVWLDTSGTALMLSPYPVLSSAMAAGRAAAGDVRPPQHVLLTPCRSPLSFVRAAHAAGAVYTPARCPGSSRAAAGAASAGSLQQQPHSSRHGDSSGLWVVPATLLDAVPKPTCVHTPM